MWDSNEDQTTLMFGTSKTSNLKTPPNSRPHPTHPQTKNTRTSVNNMSFLGFQTRTAPSCFVFVSSSPSSPRRRSTRLWGHIALASGPYPVENAGSKETEGNGRPGREPVRRAKEGPRKPKHLLTEVRGSASRHRSATSGGTNKEYNCSWRTTSSGATLPVRWKKSSNSAIRSQIQARSR